VLTLQTSDRMKDPKTIDWPAIVEYMAQYERNQQAPENSSDYAMFAHGGRSSNHKAYGARQNGSRPSRSMSDVKCYNCQKMGHFAIACPHPNAKKQDKKKHRPPT